MRLAGLLWGMLGPWRWQGARQAGAAAATLSVLLVQRTAARGPKAFVCWRPHPTLAQWYLDPRSMRLPRPAVPDSLAPPARQVMEALAVSWGRQCLQCHACWAAAAGRQQWRGETNRHAHPASACRARLPQGLVESCTQLSPEDRPTFAEVLGVLRAAAGGPETSAPPTPASLVNPF